jgi:uncharacterized protein YcbK (DUF882 family)
MPTPLDRPRARRRYLVALCAAGAMPRLAAAAAPGAAPSLAPRSLRFAHLHTGETLAVEYFAGGRYLPDALAAVNRLLRDFRSGEVAPIDPALLDALHGLAARTGSQRAFDVISGYRSPATNEALRRHPGSGVASASLHLRGQAIDIRLADVALPALRDAALSLGAGGVGYYPASDFVHVDTGRVRAW